MKKWCLFIVVIIATLCIAFAACAEEEKLDVSTIFDKDEYDIGTEVTATYTMSGGSGIYTSGEYICYIIDKGNRKNVLVGELDTETKTGTIKFTPESGDYIYILYSVFDSNGSSTTIGSKSIKLNGTPSFNPIWVDSEFSNNRYLDDELTVTYQIKGGSGTYIKGTYICYSLDRNEVRKEIASGNLDVIKKNGNIKFTTPSGNGVNGAYLEFFVTDSEGRSESFDSARVHLLDVPVIVKTTFDEDTYAVGNEITATWNITRTSETCKRIDYICYTRDEESYTYNIVQCGKLDLTKGKGTIKFTPETGSKAYVSYTIYDTNHGTDYQYSDMVELTGGLQTGEGPFTVYATFNCDEYNLGSEMSIPYEIYGTEGLYTSGEYEWYIIDQDYSYIKITSGTLDFSQKKGYLKFTPKTGIKTFIRFVLHGPGGRTKSIESGLVDLIGIAFTAEAVQSEITVCPNAQATMEVRTNGDNGEFVYQWYIYDAYFDEYGDFHETRLIEGATGASYTSTSVTENRRYLCRVYDQYGSGISVDFNVIVENHLRAEAVQNYITVSPNETAEMIINASCDEGSLTYEWIKNEYNEEGGYWYNVSMDSTDATCFSEAITELTYFSCFVKDEYGGFEQVSFVVSVENHFTVEGEQTNLTVAPNEQGEMVINASCDKGDLTYQWYKGGYYDADENWHESILIEDAIGPSYTSEPVTKYTYYWCRVVDQYKNSDIVNFYFTIDNQFTAKAIQGDLIATPNNTVQMEVNASCGIGSLFYQWYKNGYYDETGNWHAPQEIEGATGAIYTSEAIGGRTQYYCHVQDEYGNGQEIWFYISVENHLTAEAVQSDLIVAPNSTATMKVNASCDNGTIRYQWYKEGTSYYDEFGNYYDDSPIEGATGDTYISDPITMRGTYYCAVKDLYGGITTVYFYVSIDNHLTADTTVSDLKINPNGTATLEVQASCDEGALHYEWYMNDDSEHLLDYKLIEGENNPTYTTDPLTKLTRYYCYVRDEYGSSKDVQFSVNIENHLWAKAVREDITVGPNEAATMEVNAGCDAGSLTYQWYKSGHFDEMGNWHGTQKIEGATEATYTSEAIIRYTQYYCYVQDKFGNRASAWFYVSVIPIDLSMLTTLQLPTGLTRIEDNAFEGGAFQAVIIPDGCMSIGTDAFKDCANLIYVSYPSGITGIDEAFTGCNIRKMDER